MYTCRSLSSFTFFFYFFFVPLNISFSFWLLLYTANLLRLCLLLLIIVARDLNPLICTMLLTYIFNYYFICCVLILLFPGDLITSKKTTEHLYFSLPKFRKMYNKALVFSFDLIIMVPSIHFAQMIGAMLDSGLCLQHNLILQYISWISHEYTNCNKL